MLSIPNWDRDFENAKSRTVANLSWVPLPNKFEGTFYSEMMAEDDGLVLLACWDIIIRLASKCHPRGTLVARNGRPHDSRSIAIISRADQKSIGRAIEYFVSIGRLVDDTDATAEAVEVSDDDNTRATPQCHQGSTEVAPESHQADTAPPPSEDERRLEQNRTEQKGIEEEEKKDKRQRASGASFPFSDSRSLLSFWGSESLEGDPSPEKEAKYLATCEALLDMATPQQIGEAMLEFFDGPLTRELGLTYFKAWFGNRVGVGA
jgi:hypothetical protein